MITNIVVIQPIDLCNLNCSYCYLPGRKDPKLMTDQVLEASFNAVFNSSMVNPIAKEKLSILWHSGEPLTAGINFYKKSLSYLERYNTKKIRTNFEIQTNATLLNQEWCDFIKNNNIFIAISVDGPQFIHDKKRKNWSGKGSHKQVMKGIELLKKNDMPLRAICVITDDSLNYPEEIYNFFKTNGFDALCFNIDEQECINTKSSLDLKNETIKTNLMKRYWNFMSSIYDLWDNDHKRIRIREFDRLLKNIEIRKRKGFSYYLAGIETLAFAVVSISKNGDVSTFSPELAGGISENNKKFVIGNVLDINSLDELIQNENLQEQLSSVNKGVEMCAEECPYFDFCGGGSPSNKFYENGSFDTTETSFCVLTQKILLDLLISKLPKQNSIL